MIRTAIIYGMLDFCIDVLFDKLEMATIPLPENCTVQVCVGDRYPILCVNKGGTATYYFDCVVTTIDRYTMFFLHSGRYGVRDANGHLHFEECEECSIADIRDIITIE